jgi:hypothetical protein
MRHRGGVESPASAAASIPVTVSSAWRSTSVTTDPPRLTEHLVWQAAFTLAASTPIRVAALLERGGELHWALRPEDAARELELCARFAPWRFRTSEAVAVNFEGRQIRVTDAALKQDARTVAEIVAPASAHTREITTVMRLPAHDIALAFLAFAEDDTETTRLGRWRPKPSVTASLAERLAPLASGYQTGTLVG